MRAAVVLAALASALLVAPPAQAVDRPGVVVTSLYVPERVTSNGTGVDHFGRVLSTTGEPVVGVTLDLAIVPDIGPVKTLKLTTSGSGGWLTMGQRPVYSATVRTYFPGTADWAPAFATSYRLPVSPMFTITSPTTRTTTSVSSPFVVRGLISPAKPGAGIALLRFDGTRWVVVGRSVVVGNGYAISAPLPHGKHTLKLYVGRTDGNWLGYSPAFGADRS